MTERNSLHDSSSGATLNYDVSQYATFMNISGVLLRCAEMWERVDHPLGTNLYQDELKPQLIEARATLKAMSENEHVRFLLAEIDKYLPKER